MRKNFLGLDDGELERLVGLAKLARELAGGGGEQGRGARTLAAATYRPRDLLVQVLELGVPRLRDVAQQRVHLQTGSVAAGQTAVRAQTADAQLSLSCISCRP